MTTRTKPERIESAKQNHPQTYNTVADSVTGMLGLALATGNAPPSVQPLLATALQDLQALNLFAAIALEEADDSCLSRIEERVRFANAEIDVERKTRRGATAAQLMQKMFGFEPRPDRQIGFNVNKDNESHPDA